MGGGDRTHLATALGRFDLGADSQIMTVARKEHYLSWAHGFYEETQGKVGHIPGRMFHLWHGDFKDRQYTRRYDILTEHSFDPVKDITLDNQGLWKWTSDKPRLHKAVRDYFRSRYEDGRE